MRLELEALLTQIHRSIKDNSPHLFVEIINDSGQTQLEMLWLVCQSFDKSAGVTDAIASRFAGHINVRDLGEIWGKVNQLNMAAGKSDFKKIVSVLSQMGRGESAAVCLVLCSINCNVGAGVRRVLEHVANNPETIGT